MAALRDAARSTHVTDITFRTNDTAAKAEVNLRGYPAAEVNRPRRAETT